ncbi:MAG: RnfABCDGE type electron transport complex subunit D [Magnetococcus sp. DMHC-1]
MNHPTQQILSSPHVHGGESIPQVMRTVIWALMPATAFSVMLFGWPTLFVILTTVATCMIVEHLLIKMRGWPSTMGDHSAALTGLLLALTLPPHAPWWLCVVGGLFAILVGKQLYGGLGQNIFNPALISRVFLLISFPVQLTFWPKPTPLFGESSYSLLQSINIFLGGGYGALLPLDTVTGATPLGQYRTEVGMGRTVEQALGGNYGFNYLDATSGMMGGSLGETSVILLTLGGLYLLHRKVITWHIPLSMLAGCLVPAAVFWMLDPGAYPNPLFHLITGGLILGVFFMATDMVTSPVTAKGQIIFGLGCGILTYLIRTWGGYPEGVSFAIVLMNATVPLIDQYTRPVAYGKTQQRNT